jgi:hypothetical protein
MSAWGVGRRVSTTRHGLQESLHDDIECLLELGRDGDLHALGGDAETARPRTASHAIEVGDPAVVQGVERDAVGRRVDGDGDVAGEPQRTEIPVVRMVSLETNSMQVLTLSTYCSLMMLAYGSWALSSAGMTTPSN